MKIAGFIDVNCWNNKRAK